jgi:hypothetical protein
MKKTLIGGGRVTFLVFSLLLPLFLNSYASAQFAIRIEKDVPRVQVPKLLTTITFNLYDWDGVNYTLVASQNFTNGEYRVDYEFWSFPPAEDIVRIKVDFTNTAELTRDMQLWVEMEFDGVVIGQKEPLKKEAWAMFSNEAVIAESVVPGGITNSMLSSDVITSDKIYDGAVASEDVGFAYAGSVSKGGPATDLACARCVSPSEIETSLTKAATMIICAPDSPNKSNCDYYTNGVKDQEEINEAITALPLNGGEVHLRAGTYYLLPLEGEQSEEKIIINKNNVILSGEGPATRLIAVDSGYKITNGIEIPDGVSNVTIRDIWLDGNGDDILYGVVINGDYITIENSIVCCSARDGIVFSEFADYGRAINNRLYDIYLNEGGDASSALEVEDGAKKITLKNNYVYNTARCFFPHVHSWATGALEDIVFENNVCEANSYKSPIIVIADSHFIRNLKILNNTLKGSRIQIDVNAPMYDILIQGNSIIDNSDGTYGAIQAVNNSNNVLRIKVIDNYIENTTIAGIKLSSAHYGMVLGNYINGGGTEGIVIGGANMVVTNNVIIGGTTYGIMIYDSYNIIKGNYIDATNSCIRVAGGYNMITENQIRNCGIKGIWIEPSAGNSNRIIFNTIAGNQYGIDLSGGTETHIFDNHFMNNVHTIYQNGGDFLVRFNKGFRTESKGTATIGSSDTYVDVYHGLAITPNIGNISVTPISDLGSASFYWINTVNSKSFKIYVDTPPGKIISFSWQIGSYEY